MDGAIFEQQKEVGVEIVIRDHYGAVMVTLSKKLQAPLGSLEVEAKVMEEAVTFAQDMGIRDCIFESDALIIVNATQTHPRTQLTTQQVPCPISISFALSNSTMYLTLEIKQLTPQHNLLKAPLFCMRGQKIQQVVLRNWCPKMFYFCRLMNKSHFFHIKKKRFSFRSS